MLSRSGLWNDVEALIREGRAGIERKNDALVLTKLSLLDMDWLAMIPEEWCEIYSALYDEATEKNENDLAKRKTEVYSSEETIISIETERIDESDDAPTLYQKLHMSDDKKKIAKDVHRTFSVFGKYSCSQDTLGKTYSKSEERFRRSLMDVLLAASYERGYCQGLNFIAANFLLNFSHLRHSDTESKEEEGNGAPQNDNQLWVKCEKSSFICLCYLLRHSWIYILFDSRCSSLMEYMKLFEKKLRRHNNRVYKHWKTIGFDPLCVTVEWFTTCFVTTSPGELANAALDLLLAGCEDALLKVGLALIDELEARVVAMDLEQMQVQMKEVIREAPVASVLARALTMPSEIFFPDTDMLLTMVRNMDEMQPQGERNEYVYTTRPVHAPPTRASMVPRSRNHDVNAEEEEEEEEEEDDEEVAGAQTESSDDKEGVDMRSQLYFRDLGAAASLARLEAVLAAQECSEFVLEGHLSKLMRKYYCPCNADNTEQSLSGVNKYSNSPKFLGRGANRPLGNGSRVTDVDRGRVAPAAGSSAGGHVEARAERRRLRRHYIGLIAKLSSLGPGQCQDAAVEAARLAQRRVAHANGHLRSVEALQTLARGWGMLKKNKRGGCVAVSSGCRQRSAALWTLGALRGLDKTVYWKDAPRRRGWAHRLFTPSSSTGSTSSTSSPRGERERQNSGAVDQEEDARARMGARAQVPSRENTNRLSRLVAVTVTEVAGRRRSREDAVGRGEKIALKALVEAERRERSCITDDSFLPVGWRDVRLPTNRPYLAHMHGTTPISSPGPIPNPAATTRGGIGPPPEETLGEESRDKGKKKGASRRTQRVKRGRGAAARRRARGHSHAAAYAATLTEVEKSPPVLRDRPRERANPMWSGAPVMKDKGEGVDEGESKSKTEDVEQAAGGPVWGLLNTLTLGALDAVAPLAEDLIPGLVGRELRKRDVAEKGNKVEEKTEAGPPLCYIADDERESRQ